MIVLVALSQLDRVNGGEDAVEHIYKARQDRKAILVPWLAPHSLSSLNSNLGHPY